MLVKERNVRQRPTIKILENSQLMMDHTSKRPEPSD